MHRPPCLLVAAAAATGLLTGCSNGVPTLAAGSPPDVVVATYLAATQSGDADTARSLMTTDHAEQYGTDGIGGTLTDVVIDEPVRTGASTEDDPGGGLAGASEVSVRVEAELAGAGGQALTDGPITWFVTLSRAGDGAWLVSGEGTGP